MPGLFAQIQDFLLTFMLGMLLGLIFHFYQLFIRNLHPGRFLLYFIDFLLWIVMILLVFIGMLVINQGEMRVYVLIAILAGILTYFKFISRKTSKQVSSGARCSTNVLKKSFSIIKSLIKKCINFFKKIKKADNQEPPGDDD